MTSKDVYSLLIVLSVGSFFSYVNDARSHEPEDFKLIYLIFSVQVNSGKYVTSEP